MSDATRHQAWEYLTTAGSDQQDLNALGHAGWELVGVSGAGDPKLYFKRPKPSFREQVTLDQKRRYYGLLGRSLPNGGEGMRR